MTEEARVSAEELADQCASCEHINPEDCEATPCTAGIQPGPVKFLRKKEIQE